MLLSLKRGFPFTRLEILTDFGKNRKLLCPLVVL